MWVAVSESGRAVVRDDAWPGLGKGFQRLLYDNLQVEEFAGASPDPTHQLRGRQLGLPGPFAHKVDDPIA